MIDETINDGKTEVGGGKDVVAGIDWGVKSS